MGVPGRRRGALSIHLAPGHGICGPLDQWDAPVSILAVQVLLARRSPFTLNLTLHLLTPPSTPPSNNHVRLRRCRVCARGPCGRPQGPAQALQGEPVTRSGGVREACESPHARPGTSPSPFGQLRVRGTGRTAGMRSCNRLEHSAGVLWKDRKSQCRASKRFPPVAAL
eukprot:92123-Pyramimonas_sp.AAC.1